MDEPRPRYRRPLSPPRERRGPILAPLRSSTGTLAGPFDEYYPSSRVPRDVVTSPRSSSGFLEPERALARPYGGESPTTNRYHADYRRPRRSTLDPGTDQGRRPIAVSPTSAGGGPRPIVHAGGERATSPRPRAYTDAEGDYMLQPASSTRHRGAKKTYGLEVPDGSRYPRPHERGGYRSTGVDGARKGYHLSGPLVRHPDVDDGSSGYDGYGGYGYGYNEYEQDPYQPPPPRRHRGESFDGRRERPLSMVELEGYVPRTSSSREPGPPVSSRGLNRISGLGRTGSIGRGSRVPVDDAYYDYSHPQDDVAYEPSVPRPSRKRPPVPAVLHQQRAEPESYLPYDDELRDRRYSRRPDDDIEKRGFGIRGNSQDRGVIRDDSPDRYSDRPSDTDETRERHHRRHRAHDKVAEGGEPRKHKHREREDRDRAPREKEPLPRDPRERDPRDHEMRGDGHDRDSADLDELEREARKREHRERERRRREREALEGGGVGAAGAGVAGLDLRDRDPRERERERDKPRDNVDAAQEPRKEHVRVVSPPRDKGEAPIKGILRPPREKFPEDPTPIREGVAPLKEALKDGKKGIPPGARWTKVDRKLVNPAALEEANERFEERLDHVIVLRVLTREEIEAFAARTQEIRDARYDRDKLDRDRRERHRRRAEERAATGEADEPAPRQIEAPPPAAVSDPEIEGSRRANPLDEGKSREDYRREAAANAPSTVSSSSSQAAAKRDVQFVMSGGAGPAPVPNR